MWRVWGRGEGCTGFWWGNLRERNHWGDPDADGRIILRWIFRKREEVVGTGWSWLRIGTVGGHLWVRWWTFGFQIMRGIPWLAAEPVSFSRRTLLHGVNKLVFYHTIAVILNNVKPNGIPFRSEILCCMWHVLALMDLMMVKVDRNMLPYWTRLRHPVIRTQLLLCSKVIK